MCYGAIVERKAGVYVYELDSGGGEFCKQMDLTAKDKMKKVWKLTGKKTDQKRTVMEKPSNKQKNQRWLSRLAQVAEAARTHVSGYSDDRRSKLEQFARSLIQSGKAPQVCRR